MPARFVRWLTLLPLACAFKDTVPVVLWSSHSSSKLDSLATRPAPFAHTSHLFETLLEGDDLCKYDAVVIAEQPRLHASDLRTLSQTSHLSTRLRHAASALQIPYLSHSGSDSLDEFKRTLTDRCGARRVELGLGQGRPEMHKGEMHVVCLSLPQVEGESSDRSASMRDHEMQLSDEISRVTSIFPSHLVIYAGSQPFTKRQDLPDFDVTVSFAPINTTLPEGSFLQRYRLFTPGLITALLVVFGLLIPILMVGIYAVASIQSPLRMDAPKGPSLEKKNQ